MQIPSLEGVQAFAEGEEKIDEGNFEDRDEDGHEDGEPVDSVHAVPDIVVFLGGHPGGHHEKVEDEVHDQEEDYHVEDLGRGRCTMLMER